MKMRGLFLIALIALTNVVYTQTNPTRPDTISGGVLNGKALSLPKPAYPPAARAVNAEGAVSVQVMIDEQGNVVSATAVSGHPLLRAAATEAAKEAKFTPTLLMGQPVKVTGVITYNFVGSLTLGMFGYELGYAERTGRFSNGEAKSLAARLPVGWLSEKETLESLTYEAPAEVKATDQLKVSPIAKGDGNRYTAIGVSGAGYVNRKLTADSVQSIRQLQMTVESRLNSDQVAQWNFNVGRRLGNLVAEIDDENKTSLNVIQLEQLAVAAPAEAPKTAIDKLGQLIEQAKSSEPIAERRKTIVGTAVSIRSLRILQW